MSKASSETEERRLPKELKMSAHAMMDVLSTALRGLFIVFTTASTTFSLPHEIKRVTKKFPKSNSDENVTTANQTHRIGFRSAG